MHDITLDTFPPDRLADMVHWRNDPVVNRYLRQGIRSLEEVQEWYAQYFFRAENSRWCPSVYVMHSVRVREQMFQVSKFIQDGRWDTIAEQLRHCPDPSSRPCGHGWCQRIRYTPIYGSGYPIT
jgi:hypothetical protein